MNNNRIALLKSKIAETSNLLVGLQEEILGDIISPEAAKAKEKILKKELKEKKLLLLSEVHRGKRGGVLSFGNYNESKGLFVVKCTDGKKLYSTTENGLIDQMMLYYGLSLDSPIVCAIFERAIERYNRKHPDKSKTVYNYRQDFKFFINEVLSKTDIRKVNKDFLEDYLLQLIKEKKLKPNALRGCKTLLNLIFTEAIEEGFVTQNIAKQIPLKPLLQYCDQSLAHRRSEDLLFNEQELEMIEKELWHKIKQFNSTYSYAALLHMEIGCRPDELICLKWTDFDLKNRLVYIERQQIEQKYPQGYLVVEYTKNERGISQGGRLVPLSSKALLVLDELRKTQDALGVKSEWLFADKTGNLRNKGGYFRFIGKLREKLNFGEKSSYAFRRGLSAKLESKGIEPSDRAKILGHSVETNLRHYTFAKPQYLDRVQSVLD